MPDRRHRPRALPRAILPLALLTALAAHAQTPPDAGGLLREAERAPLLPPAPPKAPPAPMPPAEKGATVAVKAFVVEGASLIPAEELVRLLDDLVGQRLTLAELERAAQRIARRYRERGGFARVYLPVQDVTDGVVRIRVVEGRVGEVRLDGAAPARADADYVLRVIGNRLTIGAPLSAAELERGLLLANDLSGIRATGVLEAGQAPGETRLAVKVEDTPFVTGDIGLDNHGVKATGLWQGKGGVALNNLTGQGDRLELRALAAEDLASAQLRYSLPLGAEGWQLAARASSLRYRLGDTFAALDAKGRAESLGAELAYPLVREAARNLRLSFGLDHRTTADDSLGAPLRRRQAGAATLALFGDAVDGLGGGGLTYYDLMLTAGKLDLDLAADRAGDAAGPRAEGGYTKLTGQVGRVQNLGGGFSLRASLAAQWAGKNLDSAEKFSLGGPNGVRAYPVNEASGDEGWLARMEVAQEMGAGWSWLGFVDAGGIRQHRQPWAGWDGGSGQPNRYALAGAGLGLIWQRPGEWNAQLTLAAPLGDHPGKTADGRNQDGSRREARAWLRVVKVF